MEGRIWKILRPFTTYLDFNTAPADDAEAAYKALNWIRTEKDWARALPKWPSSRSSPVGGT